MPIIGSTVPNNNEYDYATDSIDVQSLSSPLIDYPTDGYLRAYTKEVITDNTSEIVGPIAYNFYSLDILNSCCKRKYKVHLH